MGKNENNKQISINKQSHKQFADLHFYFINYLRLSSDK